MIEEAKSNNTFGSNKMIQILEDENEYLENESDDDSNSDPSEDNFSEGELEQCRGGANKIKVYQFSLTPQNMMANKSKMKTLNYESSMQAARDTHTMLQISSFNLSEKVNRSNNSFKQRKQNNADSAYLHKIRERVNISDRSIQERKFRMELPSLERIKDSLEGHKSIAKRNYVFIDQFSGEGLKFEDIGLKGQAGKSSVFDQHKFKTSNIISFYHRNEVLKRFINKGLE